MTLCTLGIGTAFGESILNDTPRHSTVVTREYCELLRVEQKDFKVLWEVSIPAMSSQHRHLLIIIIVVVATDDVIANLIHINSSSSSSPLL